ncbi:hypothetical protein AAG570_010407 [Ranatra chinensis]|uniref:G-protein coupled receptors family 1 profile domain-containing protein n=1 Tax=Ranatra chinensis TaxID=642074 RepID=A0ABD0YMK3_9HEMI
MASKRRNIFYGNKNQESTEIGSLVFANLVSAVVLAPVLLCRQPVLSAGVSVLVATSSVFSIVSIALDRYSAVLSPLHYTMTVTRKRSAAVIGGTWCLSGALAAPHLVLPCRGGSAEWQGGGGLIGASVSPVFWLTHSLVLLLLGFTLPLIALVLIYSRMYAAAHR